MKTDIRFTVRGVDYAVDVSIHGQFSATYRGETKQADTLDALRDKMMAASKKDSVTINVPYTTRDGGDRVIVGVHGGNGNAIVTYRDRNGRPKKEQEQMYQLHDVLLPLNAAEKTELKRLDVAEQLAQSAVRRFVDARRFNAEIAARTAIAKAEA